MATTTANQALPIPQSTDAPDVVAFIVALAQATEKKLVMVFTSASQRTTKVPTPTAGMMSVLTDTNVVDLYDGAAWQRVYPPAIPAFTRGTVVPSNASGANGDVFFKLS